MAVAALVDAGVSFDLLQTGIASLNLAGVRLSLTETSRCGFRAKHLQIEHPRQHVHRHLRDIVQIVEGGSAITPPQKHMALRIFRAIAEAEARVHGTTVDQIHFHEVGAIDSIVDIVAAAIGFDLLGADEVVASAVPTGRGQVRIDHGVCTVPTPGTAELLKGMPLVDVPIDAELTTPTGAAILRVVAGRFGTLPEMTIEHIGHGAGTKSFADRANILRLIVGTANVGAASVGTGADRALVLETNIDDASGEILGYARQKLLAAGALDVYSIPIQMKKGRPGVLLGVICRPADRERFEAILFGETGTFGIRCHYVDRVKRARAATTTTTPWGPVRGKLGQAGGQTIFAAEYEDCARIAAQFNVPLRDVFRAAEAAYAAQPKIIEPGTAVPAKGANLPLAYDPMQEHAHDHSQDHDHSHDHHDHGDASERDHRH